MPVTPLDILKDVTLTNQVYHSELLVIPKVESAYFRQNEIKLKAKEFMILKANKFDKNATEIKIYDGTSENILYIPNNFLLELVKNKTETKVFNKYIKHIFHNLSDQLGHTFSIGSDPEIFVTTKNDQLLPAFTFLGSKEVPDKTSDNLPVYWDGFQAEFQTSAMGCLAYHTDSVQRGLLAVYEKAKNLNPNAMLTIQNLFHIPYEIMKGFKPEHIQLGCMPSLNVYGLKGEEGLSEEVLFRSAGGHIHFGCGRKNEQVVNNIIKALDAILGVCCVSLFANFDSPIRRRYYGLAGEYRLPPHGIEYRTLSNAWLMHPLIMNIVFDLSRKAFIFGEKGIINYWPVPTEKTIDVIQNCDVDAARGIMKQNSKILIDIIKAAYQGSQMAESAFNIFLNGAESAVAEPNNLVKNWCLDGGWIGHTGLPNKNMHGSLETLKSRKKV